MVRQREFDPGDALATAMEVFASRGYSNTSIDDVVKATGVSRYGIYGTFGNKRELFEQALEKYTERMGKASFMRLFEPDASIANIRETFVDRIEHMFSCESHSGCLVIHTAMDMASSDDDIKSALNGLLTRMSKAYSAGLRHAKEQGEIQKDIDTANAGEFLTGAFFGMTVMAQCGFSEEALLAFVDSTISAVTG